ncbi:MAG: PAS domain S-box protein, partial [Verrucomicrobiaceae bacterium]|nr:PAS domain S-box protein [Verrucomicrobiaceae bacterium]
MRLADFISANIEPILAEWEVFARVIWPDASGGATDPATLRDDAEDMLRAAVTDMRSDQTDAQQSDKSKGRGDDSPHQARVDRVSLMHGSDRHGSGFDLPAIIAEYRALRASVIRLWSESHPDPDLSDLKDLTRFNESIDQSLTEAVLAYSKLVERERQAALDDQSRQAQKLRKLNEALLVHSVRQHELTEQAVNAESALRVSEERFRGLFAAAPMAVFVCDRDAVIQNYNNLAAELWGREPKCGVERHCGSAKLWLPSGELLPHDRSPMVEVLRTGDPALNVEVFIERPDGSRLPVLVNFAALRGENGETTGAITSFVDITERKRIEDKLEEQKRLLEALTESVLDGILIISPGGEMLHHNQEFLDIWDFPAEVVEAGSDQIALNWAAEQTTDPAAFLARVNDIYSQPDIRFREEMSMKDGRVYERFGAPVKHGETRLGWVWTFRDITEQKRAQETLIRTERKAGQEYQALLQRIIPLGETLG